jgi:hypothetical protein
MKFLTSGCSFTGYKNTGWPVWLQNFGHVKNLAMPGAGNQYISESTILELCLNSYQYDCVMIMWSGLQRQDYIVDKLASSNNLPVHNDVYYFPSGDFIVDKKYVEIVKTGNECTRAIKSLLEIIKLQNYLQNNKIKYYFMSYINYWNNEEDLVNRNFGIHKYEILKKLAENINFSNFIFAENNKCLYEICLDNNFLDDDNFHPGTTGIDNWMTDYVIPRLKQDKLI